MSSRKKEQCKRDKNKTKTRSIKSMPFQQNSDRFFVQIEKLIPKFIHKV